MRNIQAVQKLLEKLSAYGESHYHEENRTGKLDWGAVGLAIADVTSNKDDILMIAYCALEDWNYHDICALLQYVAPNLFPPIKGAKSSEWLTSLRQIENLINYRGAMRVYTSWNSETGEYDDELYRLTVKVEKISE